MKNILGTVLGLVFTIGTVNASAQSWTQIQGESPSGICDDCTPPNIPCDVSYTTSASGTVQLLKITRQGQTSPACDLSQPNATKGLLCTATTVQKNAENPSDKTLLAIYEGTGPSTQVFWCSVNTLLPVPQQ